MGERLGFWERPLSCNKDVLFSIVSEKGSTEPKRRQQDR